LKGFLELWLGQIERSFEDFERAERLYKSVGNEIGIWHATYCKAIAYFEKGEYEKCKEFHNSAFDYYTSFSEGQNAFTRADLAYNLAWNDLMLGRLESAKVKEEEMKVSFSEISAKTEIRFWSNEGARKKIGYLHDLLEQEIAMRDGNADIDKILKAFRVEPDYMKFFTNTWYVDQIIDFANFPPPFIKDILPRAYIQKGNLDKAITAYEHLATLYPKRYDLRLIHPRIHYRLGKLYEQTGHKNKAIARYKKFLDLWKDADPGRPEVEDARKRLAGLSKS